MANGKRTAQSWIKSRRPSPKKERDTWPTPPVRHPIGLIPSDINKRKDLWEFLQKSTVTYPWCVLGDFNTVLKMDERVGGNPVNWEEITEFSSCLSTCGLEDLPYEGSKYTWCNNQGLGKLIYSKLDRIMGNVEWLLKFDFKACFREGGVSDHSAMILKKA
ncbi:hypothetical protein DM860_012190 [Cuscuta australis]|uniref:Endonuclease/exonuclease/phosphatase domain-containing protein n=1 Tax=Cuscuta australis TaxID=267555 RepID=A0A328E6C9_9ASTE|nr:hypothetical protein DM860_012190 [Cuscuta australis]